MKTIIKDRKDLAKLFTGVGAELGVAAGQYSNTILNNSACSCLYSIDKWNDHHDIKEYYNASKLLIINGKGRCIPLRMTFLEASQLFVDNYFSFIYIDGYAHTGQDDGNTLSQWYPKLKSGGIFAGHDYDNNWIPTVKAVNNFIQTHNLPLNITEESADPSWWTIKP